MSERALGTPAARGHHRRPAQRKLPAPRRPRPGAHRQGAPADDAAVRPGRDRTDLARTHRRMGHKLKQIEQGGLGREAFMREIAQMTQVIVKRAKEYERDTVPGDYATLRTPCPKCGAVVKENYRRFACTSCDFSIGKHRAGAPSNCRKSRNCWPSARSARCKASSARWAGPSPPSCASATRQAGIRLRPERRGRRRSRGLLRPHAGRRLPQVLVARLRARHELRLREVRGSGQDLRFPFRQGHPAAGNLARADGKLLTEGRTGLLDGFVSSRTNRKFKAFLVRQPTARSASSSSPS